jgi:hypothetical protein
MLFMYYIVELGVQVWIALNKIHLESLKVWTALNEIHLESLFSL